LTPSLRIRYRIAGRGVSRATGNLARWLFHALRESITNLILFASLALIVRGCALISEALAFLVAGAFLFAIGLLLTFNERGGHR
jgi:hypothetical protein